MDLSFKQFCQFLEEAENKSPEQIDEIFGKFFSKNKTKANDKDTETEEDGDDEPKSAKPVDKRKEFLLRKQEELAKKRDLEKERRDALRKQADERWAAAKKQAEAGKAAMTRKIGDRDDYALHRSFS